MDNNEIPAQINPESNKPRLKIIQTWKNLEIPIQLYDLIVI